MQRLNNLSNQVGQTCPQNDVVICLAVRTPLTKSKKGGLKDTSPEMLLLPLFQKVAGMVDPKLVEDITIGNVLQIGSGVAQIRMASLMAGFPDTTTAVSINRLCSSGLEAVSQVANKIQAGVIDIGLAGGVESMSMYDMMNMIEAEKINDAVFDHENARNCMMGMGQTSENVAEKFGITRQQQDQVAVNSHLKAHKAQEQGLFKSEIVPVKTTILDKDGNAKEIVVSEDDGIRKQTTLQSLGKLKPAFKKDGTTTAGNASQVTDGASVVLLAKRSVAQKLGLPIVAKYVAFAVGGVPPEIMGIGPAVAIPKVLQKANLQIKDIDIFEINEAFASQATYCIEKLGIDWNKVNPKGGAIAIGHPLGCTGSRQISTLLPELKRTNGSYGLVSMCIGTGMGAAAIFQLEK